MLEGKKNMPFVQQEMQEFNSGLAIIYQLDAIEKGLVDVTAQDNNGMLFEKHYKLLCAYFKTLYPHMKNIKDNKEKDYHKDKWVKIRNNVLDIKKRVAKGDKKIPCALIDSLDEWELELRDCKQQRGLGMPKGDPRYK